MIQQGDWMIHKSIHTEEVWCNRLRNIDWISDKIGTWLSPEPGRTSNCLPLQQKNSLFFNCVARTTTFSENFEYYFLFNCLHQQKLLLQVDAQTSARLPKILQQQTRSEIKVCTRTCRFWHGAGSRVPFLVGAGSPHFWKCVHNPESTKTMLENFA